MVDGAVLRAGRRAGLPSVAFTEDADHTVWTRAALWSHDKCDRSAGPCEHMLEGGGCGLEGEADHLRQRQNARSMQRERLRELPGVWSHDDGHDAGSSGASPAIETSRPPGAIRSRTAAASPGVALTARGDGNSSGVTGPPGRVTPAARYVIGEDLHLDGILARPIDRYGRTCRPVADVIRHVRL